MQLFMLYKAIQTVIEMGPIDALTGNSKNTIAEEKLLKMKIENRVMVNKISYIFYICIVYLNSQSNSIRLKTQISANVIGHRLGR